MHLKWKIYFSIFDGRKFWNQYGNTFSGFVPKHSSLHSSHRRPNEPVYSVHTALAQTVYDVEVDDDVVVDVCSHFFTLCSFIVVDVVLRLFTNSDSSPTGWTFIKYASVVCVLPGCSLFTLQFYWMTLQRHPLVSCLVCVSFETCSSTECFPLSLSYVVRTLVTIYGRCNGVFHFLWFSLVRLRAQQSHWHYCRQSSLRYFFFF